ncbi:IS66 family insertion sequence element accessory protein TnpB [Saprospiraceae bacterium]|nr:IS66 family insertion sequence element accessory protein TnpB [Saprospiraceae bacterium]MDB4539291.1 IS66 family insertion sequence element accessory protein TnpB [Saprospiraceae bacterium]
MLSFSSTQRYFIYPNHCDMRKGFNGLGGLVNDFFDHPLMSGDVFIFLNRRRTHIKLLMWDATGFAIYYKRLEAGTFEMPRHNTTLTSPLTKPKAIELRWSELVLLLEGIEIKSIKKRKRYTQKV